MDRFKLLVVIIIAATSCAVAQEDYSYITDRKFFQPSDLIGYDFRPFAMEVPNEYEEEFDPGAFSFGVSRSNLYVEGEGIQGVYSVNNINPTEYGYKLVLMNARDPRIQGHLKVILNRKAQVEALVFKKSKDDPEMIFFQAQISDDLGSAEETYFTDRYDFPMEVQDSIWGKQVFPFMRIHKDQNGVQERLQVADSTILEFVEKVTIIEKKKRKKRKKKKRKQSEEETEEIEEVVMEEIEVEEELEVDPGAVPPIEAAQSMEEIKEEEQDVEVKVKIVKEYFLKIRTILTFEDGKIEDLVEEIPIKKNFSLFETESKDPNIPPFELEIYPKKGKPIILQLTKKQTLSSFQIEGKKYLMRGH